jgi:heme exporter protein A
VWTAILLEMAGVQKEVGHRTLLGGVDFHLAAGEIVGLSGANGSGKTTLLRIMAGLSRPSAGTVRLFGREPGPQTRRQVGVLLEPSFLYADLTARENLVYYARLFGLAQPGAVADRWLRTVRLEGERNEQVRTFSKGMRQRLAIARAWQHDPRVLLLDEPFDGLDQRHAAQAEDMVRRFAAAGGGVVIVSHDREQLGRLAGRIVRIRAGYLTGGGAS